MPGGGSAETAQDAIVRTPELAGVPVSGAARVAAPGGRTLYDVDTLVSWAEIYRQVYPADEDSPAFWLYTSATAGALSAMAMSCQAELADVQAAGESGTPGPLVSEWFSSGSDDLGIRTSLLAGLAVIPQ